MPPGYLAIGSGIPLELVVITLTWIKTIPAVYLSRRNHPHLAPSLSYILYRDGRLPYFHALAAADPRYPVLYRYAELSVRIFHCTSCAGTLVLTQVQSHFGVEHHQLACLRLART